MAPLKDASELLRRDLELGVRRDGALRRVSPPAEQRALLRVHDQLVIGEIELESSLGSKRSDVGDVGGRVLFNECERGDRTGRGPGQRGFDQGPRICLAARDDGVVEIRGVAILVEMQEPQRGSALEHQRVSRVMRRDERDDVDEHIVPLDDTRVDAVLARHLGDQPLRDH